MLIDPALLSEVLAVSRNIRTATESMAQLILTLEHIHVLLQSADRSASSSSDTDGVSTLEPMAEQGEPTTPKGMFDTPSATPSDTPVDATHDAYARLPGLMVRGYREDRGKKSYFAVTVSNYFELFDYIKQATLSSGQSITFTYISYVARKG